MKKDNEDIYIIRKKMSNIFEDFNVISKKQWEKKIKEDLSKIQETQK